MSRASAEAAATIARTLRALPIHERGRALRAAIEQLDPASSPRIRRTFGLHCEWCGEPMERRSFNQRYCGFKCSQQAKQQTRLAQAAQRFDEGIEPE